MDKTRKAPPITGETENGLETQVKLLQVAHKRSEEDMCELKVDVTKVREDVAAIKTGVTLIESRLTGVIDPKDFVMIQQTVASHSRLVAAIGTAVISLIVATIWQLIVST